MHLAVVPTNGLTNLHTLPDAAASAHAIAPAAKKNKRHDSPNRFFMRRFYDNLRANANNTINADTFADTFKGYRQE